MAHVAMCFYCNQPRENMCWASLNNSNLRFCYKCYQLSAVRELIREDAKVYSAKFAAVAAVAALVAGTASTADHHTACEIIAAAVSRMGGSSRSDVCMSRDQANDNIQRILDNARVEITRQNDANHDRFKKRLGCVELERRELVRNTACEIIAEQDELDYLLERRAATIHEQTRKLDESEHRVGELTHNNLVLLQELRHLRNSLVNSNRELQACGVARLDAEKKVRNQQPRMCEICEVAMQAQRDVRMLREELEQTNSRHSAFSSSAITIIIRTWLHMREYKELCEQQATLLGEERERITNTQSGLASAQTQLMNQMRNLRNSDHTTRRLRSMVRNKTNAVALCNALVRTLTTQLETSREDAEGKKGLIRVYANHVRCLTSPELSCAAFRRVAWRRDVDSCCAVLRGGWAACHPPPLRCVVLRVANPPQSPPSSPTRVMRHHAHNASTQTPMQVTFTTSMTSPSRQASIERPAASWCLPSFAASRVVPALSLRHTAARRQSSAGHR